jgi:hypothetical protein
MSNFKLFFRGGFHSQIPGECIAVCRGVDLAGVTPLRGPRSSRLSRRKGGVTEGLSERAELCKNCDAWPCLCQTTSGSSRRPDADAVKAGAPLKGIICEKPLTDRCEDRQLVALPVKRNCPRADFENQIHRIA